MYNNNPNTKIAVMVPFMSVFKDEIKQIAKDFGAEHGISILYIDTDGWVPKEPVHPLRVNHKIAAEKLCTILKEHFNL